MSRDRCRNCDRQPAPGERYCCPYCRLLHQGKVKPDAGPVETWEMVTKSTKPGAWGRQ